MRVYVTSFAVAVGCTLFAPVAHTDEIDTEHLFTFMIGTDVGEQPATDGSRLFGQMKPAAHLPLNRPSGTIGDFLVSCSVQSYSNGEVPAVLPDKLNAANGFTTGPLPDGLKTLFAESPIA